MGPGEAIADIDRYGIGLAESLLGDIDPVRVGFRGARGRGIDTAAHQLLWRHYMVTGGPAFGDAVLASLRTNCRSARHDGLGAVPDRAVSSPTEQMLGDNALLLELLTWVWRQCRCPELRTCAEGIAIWALQQMRVPGLGFAARSCGHHRDDAVRPDWNGLMLVALIEAGSVLDRRDMLAAAREVFDEIVSCLGDDETGLYHAVADERMGGAGHLDDLAMMSRAAIRAFEAFGKRRYMDCAEAWVARLDGAFWEPAHGYRMREAAPAATIRDAGHPSGNALMIGVLARLHALTGQPRYAERAEALVGAFHRDIKPSGPAGATAVAAVQTLSQPVSIKVSGDPKLEETRALMRIALDFALPDRLVLGPGAGDPADASPRALIRLGTRGLAPIVDAARLRAFLAPGALHNAL